MIFTIKERLIAQSILPEQSGKMTMIICEDIRRKVLFSEEERAKYHIQVLENGWKWDDQYNQETISINFTESELTVLKEQSKRLDNEKRITRDMLSLIRKIDEASLTT